MSYVTNVILILSCGSERDSEFKVINDKIIELGGRDGLKRVDQYAGGDKKFEVDVYMGAFKYVERDSLVDWFTSTEFSDDEIQLLIRGPEDDDFTNIFVRRC